MTKYSQQDNPDSTYAGTLCINKTEYYVLLILFDI